MEYNASAVKHLLWFVETRETIRLLQKYTSEEAKKRIIEDNIYQQKDRSRLINEYGCIIKRIEGMPDDLKAYMLKADVSMAKVTALIAAMNVDRALYEFVYEVYRNKLHLGDEELRDSDWETFFAEKVKQSDEIAAWSDGTRKKLRQVYGRFLIEAGLLQKKDRTTKRVVRIYVDDELQRILKGNGMEKYLEAITGA